MILAGLSIGELIGVSIQRFPGAVIQATHSWQLLVAAPSASLMTIILRFTFRSRVSYTMVQACSTSVEFSSFSNSNSGRECYLSVDDLYELDCLLASLFFNFPLLRRPLARRLESEQISNNPSAALHVSTVSSMSFIVNAVLYLFCSWQYPFWHLKNLAISTRNEPEVKKFFDSLLASASLSNSFAVYACNVPLLTSLHCRSSATCSTTLYRSDRMLLCELWSDVLSMSFINSNYSDSSFSTKSLAEGLHFSGITF